MLKGLLAGTPARRSYCFATLGSSSLFEQLHDIGHVEIAKIFIDRSLEYVAHYARGGHRRISSSRLHGIAKVFFEKSDWKQCLEIACEHRFHVTCKVGIPHCRS